MTKTSPALSRWALSFNLRTNLGHDTKVAFGLGTGDDGIHSESTQGRMKRDFKDEDALLTVLQRFGVFFSLPAPDTAKHCKQRHGYPGN